MNISIQQAVETIRQGGCLIFPTETLYAIGSDACQEEAVMRVARLKSRPGGKPFPVLIGSTEQLPLVTSWDDASFLSLTAAFWPGPLSILVPARKEIASLAKDGNGWTSLRWTDHPAAQRLSLESGCPLIATSANRSGQPSAFHPSQLDEQLCRQADGLLPGPPYPPGGLPSTVVAVSGQKELTIVRHGAVSQEQLEAAGYRIRPACPETGEA
jgi:L-threonylcarbamoyladenylate synthase